MAEANHFEINNGEEVYDGDCEFSSFGANKDILEKTRLLSDDGCEEEVFSRSRRSTFVSPQEEIPYPKSVFFIIGNEFCERFSFYGMRAILTLYMRDVLKYTEDSSTVLFHSWTMLCYFTPVLGAMLADSYLGRYKTILYVSMIYLCGNAVLSFAAVSPLFSTLSVQTSVSIMGLVLIAIGTGGIKSCVSAFGGDQFILPQQQKQLSQYFSMFYFSINAGSLLSTFATPILREDVSCFGTDCYSLAFGVPAVLMLLAIVLFAAGSSKYRRNPPEGNIVFDVVKCILYGITKYFRSQERQEHWLDHSASKYDPGLIQDIKDVLKVLFLFLPLPFFWALYDQQGSRWTFQATRMNGNLGFWDIKPDQMQLINPLLVLLLIPLFEKYIYPFFAKYGMIKKPLQKMVVGGFCTAASFVVSGIIETQLENSTPSTVHMLWLIPQYILVSVGEVLFSITGLEFSFTQAPASMKCVVQSAWLSTISIGNFIVVLIAHSNYFKKKSLEFYLFAALMVLDMCIFIVLAMRYKYVEPKKNNQETTPEVFNIESD